MIKANLSGGIYPELPGNSNYVMGAKTRVPRGEDPAVHDAVDLNRRLESKCTTCGANDGHMADAHLSRMDFVDGKRAGR